MFSHFAIARFDMARHPPVILRKLSCIKEPANGRCKSFAACRAVGTVWFGWFCRVQNKIYSAVRNPFRTTPHASLNTTVGGRKSILPSVRRLLPVGEKSRHSGCVCVKGFTTDALRKCIRKRPWVHPSNSAGCCSCVGGSVFLSSLFLSFDSFRAEGSRQ